METERKKSKETEKYSFILNLGENLTDDIPFKIYVSDFETEYIPEGYVFYSKELINKEKVSGQLTARNRLPGDTIRLGGMTKKVKELLCKSKLPLSVRENLPFICDESGIVCIPGVCTSDIHKIKNTEENNKLFIYIYSKTTL